MSGRKPDAPLAVQAASLKKTMQNRERRRHSDRARKVVGSPASYYNNMTLLLADVALMVSRRK